MDNLASTQLSVAEIRRLFHQIIDDYFKGSKPLSKEANDNLMTVEEAQKLLGMSHATLYSKTATGEIPFHKRGGKLYFFRSDLIEWIKGNTQKASKTANQ